MMQSIYFCSKENNGYETTKSINAEDAQQEQCLGHSRKRCLSDMGGCREGIRFER